MDDRSGLCIGCLRTLDEIVRWGRLDDRERKRIVDAIPQRRLNPPSAPAKT